MAQKFSNNLSISLPLDINDTQIAIDLPTVDLDKINTLGAGDFELLTLNDGVNIEVIKVTAKSATDITIERGQEGVAASAFAAQTVIQGFITKETLDRFETGFNVSALNFDAVTAVAITADSAINSASTAQSTADNNTTEIAGLLDSIMTVSGQVLVDPNGNVVYL